jgi:hypothetical protein
MQIVVKVKYECITDHKTNRLQSLVKKYNSLSTGNQFLDNGKIALIVAPALKEARAALSFTSRRVTAKYNHQQKVTHHHKYIDATLIRHQNKKKE